MVYSTNTILVMLAERSTLGKTRLCAVCTWILIIVPMIFFIYLGRTEKFILGEVVLHCYATWLFHKENIKLQVFHKKIVQVTI